MLQTEELYYLQYIMLFPAEWRCPLSDYYMKTADLESGRAFVLKADEKPVAYAVLEKENQGWVLKYIFTDKNERRKGFASYLIREIVSRTEKYLRVHIVQSQPFFNAIAACLDKLGFVINDASHVYAAAVGESLWKHIDKLNLARMKEILLRDGSECIHFCDMDDGVKNQLLHSSENAFSNELNPAALLQNSAENVDYSISTALVKNGELKAYALITRPSQSAVTFEQISEAKDELGSGRIAAPICAALEVIRKIPEITAMKLTISDRNKRSYRFVTRVFSGQEITSTQNISFIITKELLK